MLTWWEAAKGFALVYDCLRWGLYDLPPQAGIAVFERGRTGSLRPFGSTTTWGRPRFNRGGQRRLPDIRVLPPELGGIPTGRLSAFEDASR
jgi:hypothetical protein